MDTDYTQAKEELHYDPTSFILKHVHTITSYNYI